MIPPKVFDYLRVHASYLPHCLLVHITFFREIYDHLIDSPSRILQPRNSHRLIRRLGSILSRSIGRISLMYLCIGERFIILSPPFRSFVLILNWRILSCQHYKFFDYKITPKEGVKVQNSKNKKSPFINISRGPIQIIQQQIEVIQHRHLHQPLINHQVITCRPCRCGVEVRSEDVISTSCYLIVTSNYETGSCCGRVVLTANDVGVGLQLLGLGQLVQKVVCGPGFGVVVEVVLHGRAVGCAQVGLQSVDCGLGLVNDDWIHCYPWNVDDCGTASHYQYQKNREQIDAHCWKIIIIVSIIALLTLEFNIQTNTTFNPSLQYIVTFDQHHPSSKGYFEFELRETITQVVGLQQMNKGICEQLRPFRFYSLEQFEYKQLIKRSKYFVGHFLHLQSRVNYIIKEVPYKQKTISVLKKISHLQSSIAGIVSIMGACIFKAKIGWQQTPRLRLQENKQKQQRKQYKTILIFMEKYEMNLLEYINLRRKQLQLFTVQEIKGFISRMLDILESLQKKKIAHRDVKPENILVRNHQYFLCDFEDSIEFDFASPERFPVDLTTIQYSSPEFLRFIRQPKDKCFDPFKLDVYSLGLTLLYICSMGKFSLEQRANFIYESSQRSHFDFIKQQRVKWVRNQGEYKLFNSLVKMMLEQDEYKRDDFCTLKLKIQLNDNDDSDEAYSQQNSNSKSSAKMRQLRDYKKMIKQRRQHLLKNQQFKIYGYLSLSMIALFILLCLL